MKIFRREDFAYHKVSVVFWQFDEHDQPAIITEPYEKAFTAANLKKEQEFYDSDLTFRVRAEGGQEEKTVDARPSAPRTTPPRSSRQLMERQARDLSLSNGPTATT